MEISPVLYALLEALDKAVLDAGAMQGLPRGEDGKISYEKALQHTSGDSLLDFIVIETVEGTEGYSDEELPEKVSELLGRAAGDLQVVADAALACRN
jgi:hypothetical protein